MNRLVFTAASLLSLHLVACAADTSTPNDLGESPFSDDPNESDVDGDIGQVGQAQTAYGGCVVSAIKPVLYAGRVYGAAATSSYFSSVRCKSAIYLLRWAGNRWYTVEVTNGQQEPGAPNTVLRTSTACKSGTYASYICTGPDGTVFGHCETSRAVNITCPTPPPGAN